MLASYLVETIQPGPTQRASAFETRDYNLIVYLPIRAYLSFAVAALAVNSPGPSIVTKTTKLIEPGVVLTQLIQTDPAELIDVLTVDPKASRAVVAPGVANGSLTDFTGDIRKGRESVAAYVSRTGALAAVNGDYFPYTGDPLGLGISDGEIYSEPYTADTAAGRAAIGWLPSGRVIVGIPAMQARITAADGFTLPISGIDRLTSTTNLSDACVITPRFGPTSGGRGLGTEIVFTDARPFPLRAGVPVTGMVSQVSTGAASAVAVPADGFVVTLPTGSPLSAGLDSHFHIGEAAVVSIEISDDTPAAIGTLGGSWNRVVQAIGGGPILLRSGRVIVDDVAEGLGGAFSTAPHARTSVGQRPDGTIVIVTVDAGSPLSAGMSLSDLAVLMQRLGAVDAINLDGGGSTTMAVQGGVTVDFPSGTAYERPVADLLTVRTRSAPNVVDVAAGLDDFRIEGVPDQLIVGQSCQLSVTSSDGRAAVNPASVLWNGPAGSSGYVSQDGVLHVLSAGHGVISARVSGLSISRAIDVPAPAPSLPLEATQPNAVLAPGARNDVPGAASGGAAAPTVPGR